MEAFFEKWDEAYNKLDHETAKDVNKTYEGQGRRDQEPTRKHLRELKEARRERKTGWKVR